MTTTIHKYKTSDLFYVFCLLVGEFNNLIHVAQRGQVSMDYISVKFQWKLGKNIFLFFQ